MCSWMAEPRPTATWHSLLKSNSEFAAHGCKRLCRSIENWSCCIGASDATSLLGSEPQGGEHKVIDRLAADLRRAFPEMTGISARNLKYMRAFAQAWPGVEFVQQVAAQLPWGHNTYLLDAVKPPAEREWYARPAIPERLEPQCLCPSDRKRTIRAAGQCAHKFLQDTTSRTIATGATDHQRSIQLRFPLAGAGNAGTRSGACFDRAPALADPGTRQGIRFRRQSVSSRSRGQDYYLDLLFYHLRLRCFVAFELKVEGFKPEFAGKMNFYLSAVDDQLRHPHDQASIGIILCKGRNEVIVEYALRDTSKPMGVAQYRL